MTSNIFIKRTNRTWGVFVEHDATGKHVLLEGGFFTIEAAADCANEWRLARNQMLVARHAGKHVSAQG